MKATCVRCGTALEAGHRRASDLRSLCPPCGKAAIAQHERATTTPPDIAGYHIVSPLAHGAYGTVYRAMDAEGRLVALKLLSADGTQSNEAVERFQREAQATMSLAHPNIVRVLDAGYASRRHFIAMEFIGGTSLRELLESDGDGLALGRAVEILRDVSRALHHAHTRGVIHRDLKPENVLLTEDGVPKISDFGIAKLAGTARTRLTAAGIALGTPEYMSPEQAMGRSHDADERSDVYTTGVILYEAATGRLPFVGRSVVDTLRKIEHGEFTPPALLDPQIDASLESVIVKAMALLPNLRYPTAHALADDLDRWLRKEPVTAPPLSMWGRLVDRLVGRKGGKTGGR